MNSKKFLVTGHPRCGTGYMHKLLEAFGYEIGHEIIKKDGISSWFFAVQNDTLWIKEKRKDFNFEYVIHNVRNPYTALNSIAFTETPRNGETLKKGSIEAYAYRKKYIKINEKLPFYERAAISFIEWNNLIEKQKIAHTFIRVEDGPEMLEAFFKKEKIKYHINKALLPSTDYNGRIHKNLNLNHYFDLSNETLKYLNDFCNKYGYEKFTDQVKKNYSHKMFSLIGNSKIYYHLDHIGKIIRKNSSFYEQSMLNYCKNLYKKGNIIDVGANIGNHTVFFSQFAEHVYSIEPIKSNFKLLKRNVEENKLNNVSLYEIGISLSGDNMSEIIVPHNMGMSKLIKSNDLNNPINTIKGDDLKLENVSILKIDCEDMSLEVLKSFEKTIEKNKPHLFIETDPEIMSYINSKGWKIIRRFNSTPTYHVITF